MNYKATFVTVFGFAFFLGISVLFFVREAPENKATDKVADRQTSISKLQVTFDHQSASFFSGSSFVNKHHSFFKSGIVEDAPGVNQHGGMDGVDSLSKGIIPTWKLGWGAKLISGDVVELDDGHFLRRAIVSTSRSHHGDVDLVLFVETFDKKQRAIGQACFDAERISVRTRPRSHSVVLGLLQQSCHRDVVGSMIRNDGSGGEIWLDAPAHASGIFGFLQHVQGIVGNYAKAELVELGF